jgi:hypothetical protein
MNPKLTRKMLVTIVLAVILVPYLIAQDKHDKACNGLHAAIGGEVVRRDPSDTQPPFVMLTFVLLNDSEASIDTAGESWQIVIDGKELKDSGFIFGNGPQPVGGWGVLRPGESFQFGKGLELGRYFPDEREYKVAWKGKGFRSSTILVRNPKK